jgi:hypothetical protein
MRGERTNRGFGVITVLALAAALVLPGGPGTTAEPAAAAFPGSNGLIVFASQRTTGPGVNNPEGDGEIFAMSSDGSNVQQLTFNIVPDSDPPGRPMARRSPLSPAATATSKSTR